MPNLLLLLQLLSLSRVFVCSKSNPVKTWEIPETSIIRLTDGRPHHFHLSSEFIARTPLISIESSEELARFFVIIIDPNLHATNHGAETISITIPVKSLVPSNLGSYSWGPLHFRYGTGKPYTIWVPGRQFSMDFRAANNKPVELHLLRFFRTIERNVCKNKTNHRCGNRCLWEEAKCDGQEQCHDGSDEKNCSPAPTSTYKFIPAYRNNYTDRRHCDLSGAALYDPPEGRRNKAWYWYVVAYSTGIIISTVMCSLVAGFCFMPPYLNGDEDELELEHRRRDTGQDGERRLDPLLDHPPSYEDVMKMDLSATPHRDAVPKRQSLDSPT